MKIKAQKRYFFKRVLMGDIGLRGVQMLVEETEGRRKDSRPQKRQKAINVQRSVE
jgi:hypothetical protein